jgi:hypothetical protein
VSRVNRSFTRRLEAQGWSVELTRGNHLVCRHPKARHPVFSGTTPSDHRSFKNLTAQLRRALKPPET